MTMDRLVAPKEPEKRFEQEWGTFLNEVRTALPGVQLLFGFLITMPFYGRFQELTGGARLLFFGCFLTTAASTAFLIAPTVYHRLHWRRDVQDKEEMFRTCNLLALIGEVLLAVAMSSALFMTSYFFIDRTLAWIAMVVVLPSFGWLWFGLPLARRQRERGQHESTTDVSGT
jgi:SNF family Na+-dependent transporter